MTRETDDRSTGNASLLEAAPNNSEPCSDIPANAWEVEVNRFGLASRTLK